MSRVIRVGSRKSMLAMSQTNIVLEELRRVWPNVEFKVVPIITEGDEDLRGGQHRRGKDAFVRAIEEKLLARDIDFAVHSMKDLPAKLPKGLTIAAVPRREDPRDALISREGKKFSELPEKAGVGTSSIRRRIQLLSMRPDLEVVELRGNVNTRIRKLRERNLDAIVVAFAGLKRIGLADKVTEVFPIEAMLPAPGQGALAVEAREEDDKILEILKTVDRVDSRACVEAERAFMETVGGGCDVPMAAYAYIIDEGKLLLEGMATSPDSIKIIRASGTGEISEAVEIGCRLAEDVMVRLAQVSVESDEN
ncbi:MAG: hydroxymethylbilane synthase [Candidatus Bathyarchaeia archaeon]